MNNESGAAKKLPDLAEIEVTEDQVASYLAANPDFFRNRQELLADLTLPHQSGEAVSLLERQVSILRERTYHAHEKLGSLLENASKNDQLFELTRGLVLSLLRAKSATQLADSLGETLLRQDSVDACQLVLTNEPGNTAGEHLTIDNKLAETFADVFRLNHTHCGQPTKQQLALLFGKASDTIRSTALCPIVSGNRQLGILAIGSVKSNYFNVNLDTLFLDFIGHVIAAVLEGQLSR